MNVADTEDITVMDSMNQAIEQIYESLEGDEISFEYHIRHRVNSLCILTMTTRDKAIRAVDLYRNSFKDKIVIEIGAGVGLFALECAKIAKEVYAIEADPAWSWVFTKYLYQCKPANLIWVFGTAEFLVGKLTGDVCVIFSHSDVDGLAKLGHLFAPQVILGYQSWQQRDKYKSGMSRQSLQRVDGDR
jgi:hypothetical protein